MPYRTLGSRQTLGQADTTGNNTGNWTVTFDPNLLNANIPEFECWKIVVKGAAATATFDVFVNGNQWDISVYAKQNSWDPVQPMILRPGDTLYFYYSTASSDGNQPNITIWLRYDVALTSVFGG
jgi:hypothetical protein